MKLMIQIKVSPEEAEKFILGLEKQGYHSERANYTGGRSDIHFKVDGKTSIDYSVSIFEDEAYIGVRPA